VHCIVCVCVFLEDRKEIWSNNKVLELEAKGFMGGQSTQHMGVGGELQLRRCRGRR